MALSFRLAVSPASLVTARNAASAIDAALPDLHCGGQDLVETADALAVMRGQGVGELSGRGLEVGDQPLVGDDRLHRSGERDEASTAQLDAGGGRDHLFQLMRFVEHDDLMLGQHRAVGGEVHAVEVAVDDDHVGVGGVRAGSLREARLADRAAGDAGALSSADRQRRPRVGRRLEGEVGSIAGLGFGGPLDQPQQLGARRSIREWIDAGYGELLVAAEHFFRALQAEVVGAALQRRVRERSVEMGGEEREVFADELVLQRLGRGGDHCLGT